jgi:NAD(P)-dependent dehydrogenase (short-subunit alcohol dehydrogenase family)
VDITDQVAIVTGGSRGIGLAVAAALLEAGARVIITGRNPAHLADAARATAPDRSDRLVTLQADVRRHDDAVRAVEAATSRFGGLDVLVNNAGIGRFADVADLTPEHWAEVIDTNLTGVFHACHAAVPALRRRGGGFIVNISSLAGKNPFAGGGAYCASKAGLNAFSEVLMQEVRYDNIRVSCVMPGSVATGFGGDPASGADWKLSPDDVAQVVIGLLETDRRSLPSRVELRPSKPRK